MLKQFLKGMVIPALIAVVAIALIEDRNASGLSNPNKNGKNVRVVATTTWHRVPASGQNCAVTFVNMSGEVLCTGYATALPGDGGTQASCGAGLVGCGLTMQDGGVTCLNSVDVCNSTAVCTALNGVTRDTVPDGIWYAMKTAADGGVGIRIEMSGGCQPQ